MSIELSFLLCVAIFYTKIAQMLLLSCYILFVDHVVCWSEYQLDILDGWVMPWDIFFLFLGVTLKDRNSTSGGTLVDVGLSKVFHSHCQHAVLLCITLVWPLLFYLYSVAVVTMTHLISSVKNHLIHIACWEAYVCKLNKNISFADFTTVIQLGLLLYFFVSCSRDWVL